jgi:hypothetical protein
MAGAIAQPKVRGRLITLRARCWRFWLRRLFHLRRIVAKVGLCQHRVGQQDLEGLSATRSALRPQAIDRNRATAQLRDIYVSIEIGSCPTDEHFALEFAQTGTICGGIVERPLEIRGNQESVGRAVLRVEQIERIVPRACPTEKGDVIDANRHGGVMGASVAHGDFVAPSEPAVAGLDKI